MMNLRTPESVNGAVSASKSQNENMTFGACLFEQVVKRHRAGIISTICQRYKNSLSRDAVEDIVQDTCLELWQWSQKHADESRGVSDYRNLWVHFASCKASKQAKTRHALQRYR